MQIRFLEYLLALSQEGHFARAAQRCHVSQPTLSSGLAALEEQLGKRLVERDRRFQGLTAEGAAILPWAQQVVAAFEGLTAAAASVRGPLKGRLRLGVIPAAMPAVGFLAQALNGLYPDLELACRSLSSNAIVQALSSYEIDAGLTYIDHEAPAHVISVDLYGETPCFLVAESRAQTLGATITPAEALEHPLCLLDQSMQNRRILDEQLARHGLIARPAMIADSYEALIAAVASGRFATILPGSYRLLLPEWARTATFGDAMTTHRIGLVVPDRKPLSPFSQAALATAGALDLPADFS